MYFIHRLEVHIMNVDRIPRAESDQSSVAIHANSVCAKRTDPTTNSNSLIALRDIKAGECITRFAAAAIHEHPTYLTVQVDDGQHIELWPEQLQYTNHSCAPVAFFDTESFEMQAIRDIRSGDDITFFYPSTEWHMQQPFACACGRPECVGMISGADSMPSDVLAKYKLSAYIRQKRNEQAA
jgi:hypothetical protein